MISALIYLQVHSFKNALVRRVKRLKQPKYLLGAIAGAAYIWFYFLRFTFGATRPSAKGVPVIEMDPLLIESLAALAFFVVVFLGWLLPNKRAALAFSEPEIAFLFPAPISRQGLIHYKLIRSQSAILITTLFLTLFTGRWRGGRFVLGGILGWWVILSTLNLHAIAVSFLRTKLLDRGITNWQRRLAVLAGLVLAIGGIALWARFSLPPLRMDDLKSLSDFKDYFQQLLVSGPLPYLLYPFRLIIRPYQAKDLLHFLLALGPALLIMAANYWWVIRANVAFEEDSVELSQKLAERIAAARAGRWQGGVKPKKAKRPPFKLRPVGLPAVALLWKNLIATGVFFTARTWLLIGWLTVFPAIIITMSFKNSPGLFIVGFLAVGLLAMSFLSGPQMLRSDLRQDLVVADVLKLYPMRGWQVVLGELLAPLTILTAVQWFLILVSIQFFGLPEKSLGWDIRIAFGLGLAVLAPGLNLISLLIPNAAVLLFPGWVTPGKDAQRGIETMGQGMILLFGQVLVFTLSLVPAAMAFAAVWFLAKLVIGWVASIPLGAIAAVLVLLLEGGIGVFLLGKLFERFDLSAELNN